MRNAIIEEDLRFITNAALPWERLKGKSVMVSGASGFLPAYMVETLLYLNESRGYGIKVLGLVRNPDKAHARFSVYAGRGDLSFITQDLGRPLGFF